MTKYFLIAGEASGDVHAATLMTKIRQRESDAVFAGFGGDRMEAAGCHLYRHLRHMAFMGFAEVIRHQREVQENFRIAHEALLKEQPDVLILVDYPSFNLRIAHFCKRQLPNTKIDYYIPPKVWAWKHRRIHQIARLCDEIWGIFPFEPAYYAHYGYTCKYVGNPTAEAIENLVKGTKTADVERKKIVAILPGSRPSEIANCLPKMLEAARQFSDYTITVCAAPNISDDFYSSYLREGESLTRETYITLQQASAAIVNSGTATLETALLGCPQVAVYHLACSRLLGWIRWAQPFIFSIKHFTLVNIICGKEVIKECLANDFTVDKVTAELQRLLTDEAYKKEMLASYEHLHSLLAVKA